VWVAALLLAGGLYWFQRSVPSMIDMVTPFYAMLVLVVLAASGRWLYNRYWLGDRRRTERRRIRRRHPFRRPKFDENHE
jgi:hypothetical protein